jgi:hypothetical protein
MHWLLVTANVVPGSPSLATLMMDVIHSSEMLVLTRATWHHIPEVVILQRLQRFHRHWFNLKKLNNIDSKDQYYVSIEEFIEHAREQR